MKRRPAVRVLLPYMFGLLLAARFVLKVPILLILSVGLMILLCMAYKKRWLSLSSTLILLFFSLVGALRYETVILPPPGLDAILGKRASVQAPS